MLLMLLLLVLRGRQQLQLEWVGLEIDLALVCLQLVVCSVYSVLEMMLSMQLV